MATSGSFTSTFGTNNMYSLIISWTRNSVDIANNKSNVTVTVSLRSGGSSYNINSNVAKSGTLTINGSSTNVSFSCALSGNQTKQIATRTMDIYHNGDGTKSFSMSFSGTIGISFSSGTVNTISVSGTGTLDTIPRTSSFSLNTYSGTLGSTNFIVTINRASTAFTHKVTYRFGGITWVGTTNATTSFSFTPAIGDCSQIPNSTSGTGTVIVETFNGSTWIGSASASITLYVPNSVKPSFSSLRAEVVNAGADVSYGYVQGKSKCRVSIQGAQGAYGSKITSYFITDHIGSDWWSSQIETGVLWSAGQITYGAYIVDSRGRASDAKYVTINIQAYSSPTISGFSAIRCLANGNSSDSGTNAKVTANFSYSSLGGKNKVTGSIYYCVSASFSWVSGGTISSGSTVVVGGNAISASNSYDLRLTVSDNFGSTTKTITIPPQFVLLDFKSGGNGIGIGKISSRDNALEIAMKTYLSKGMHFLPGAGIEWSNDSDGAKIFFESVGDTGTHEQNYLCIQTYDNDAEDILFNHRSYNRDTIINLFRMCPGLSSNVSYQHLRSSHNGQHDLGGSSHRWRTVYAVNAFNTSDVSYKENLKLIEDKNDKIITLSNDDITEENITLNDMREFIKDECDIYRYNYIGQENEEYGFVAQNIAESKVGSKLVVDTNEGYMYSTGTYMGIIVGALKEEIKVRDIELEEQKQINGELNDKVSELEERLAKLEKLLNNE